MAFTRIAFGVNLLPRSLVGEAENWPGYQIPLEKVTYLGLSRKRMCKLKLTKIRTLRKPARILQVDQRNTKALKLFLWL